MADTVVEEVKLGRDMDIYALEKRYPGLLVWPIDEAKIKAVSEETGIPYASLDIAAKRALLVDGFGGGNGPEVIVGNEADMVVEFAALQFLKDNLPEEIDPESNLGKGLASPFPYIRREAINSAMRANGLTYAFSSATASADDASPHILGKIVSRCINELIENRMKGDFSCELPDYFFDALRNKNTPHEVFVDAITKLSDPRWQVDMMQKFVMTTVSNLTTSCLLAWENAHGKPEHTVTKVMKKATLPQVESEPQIGDIPSDLKPKPVRRMGAMEGGIPE